MMGGWIYLCCRAPGAEALLTAPQIGCTKTTATGHLRMSQKEQGCIRSGGPAESASETTTTMALTIFSAAISGRTRFTAITVMELSPMWPRMQGFGTISPDGVPVAPSWISTSTDIWISSFPTMCAFLLRMLLLRGKTPTVDGKEFASNAGRED